MARAITHIEQDMDDLEQEVVAIAQELSETYCEYLTVLGEAVQHQVILTTYHLCTHGYPQRFLKKSLSERQELQQAVQGIAKKARHALTHSAQLDELTQPFSEETDGANEETADDDDNDAMLRNLSAFVRRVLSDDSSSDKENSRDSDSNLLDRLSNDADQPDQEGDRPSHRLETIIIPENLALDFLADAQLVSSDHDSDALDSDALDRAEQPADNEESDDGDFQEFSVHVAFTNDDGNNDSDEPNSMVSASQDDNDSSLDKDENVSLLADISILASPHSDVTPTQPEKVDVAPKMTPSRPTPKALIRRCERLEKHIHAAVKKATNKTNQLLQTSSILPQKLPDAVLEAALKSELSSSDSGRSPNVLNLLVETSGSKEKPKIMQVMAVRLRVEELEFNNPTLTAWRSRIRELSAQLRTFDKTYRKLQREKFVADAEATWRSTWYESDD